MAKFMGEGPAHEFVQPMNANPFATLCPKPKPDTQKTPPKGYQNGGGHPIR